MVLGCLYVGAHPTEPNLLGPIPHHAVRRPDGSVHQRPPMEIELTSPIALEQDGVLFAQIGLGERLGPIYGRSPSRLQETRDGFERAFPRDQEVEVGHHPDARIAGPASDHRGALEEHRGNATVAESGDRSLSPLDLDGVENPRPPVDAPQPPEDRIGSRQRFEVSVDQRQQPIRGGIGGIEIHELTPFGERLVGLRSREHRSAEGEELLAWQASPAQHFSMHAGGGPARP